MLNHGSDLPNPSLPCYLVLWQRGVPFLGCEKKQFHILLILKVSHTFIMFSDPVFSHWDYRICVYRVMVPDRFFPITISSD